MKFCYIDESGTGEEPYAVMVGIVVDTYRMGITKNEWAVLLNNLSKLLGKQISEIHTAGFYKGNGIWHGLNGKTRAEIISSIFEWLKQRNHSIVYTAVDKAKFKEDFSKEPLPKELDNNLWCFMALHICLALQKCHKKIEENKGNTLLIFDNKETEKERITKLIMNCPDWTDSYYGRVKKQEKLDQIIDAPYFADSKHVGLIQVADFVSFFLRRYIEIKMGIIAEYGDETKKIEDWVNIALKQTIPTSSIYLKKGRCDCADLFYRYAPPCLL
jgi:hypothetical protein